MNSATRNTIIFFSIFLSISVMTAHKLGGFDIELDLLNTANHTSLYGNSSDNINHTLERTENTLILKCKVLYEIKDNYCSLTILLSETGDFPELTKGADLTIYSYLDMDMEYSAPIGSPNLRVSIRNYDPAYSLTGEFESLKYSSIAFEPQFENSVSTMPLSSFSVEDWWIERYKIPTDLTKTEFSNVPFIEILPNEIQHISDYDISVKRFILRGKLISETTLMSIILSIWLIVIVAMVRQNTRHLKYIATTDSLTGCINRRGLSQWMSKKLRTFYEKDSITIFYIDIDDFKKINDTHGHNVGDELLSEVAKRLQKSIQKNMPRDLSYKLSRLAGDEFAIVIFDLNLNAVTPLAEKFISEITQPMYLDSASLRVSTSIGVVYTEQITKDSFKDLLDQADMAMYFAKRHGKNQFKIFDETIAQDIYFRKKTSEKLKEAILKHEFHLNFQPIYDCQSLKIIRAEVLIRCKAEELKGIGPDIYIPIAEEFNIIHDIDMWVIETALKSIHNSQSSMLAQPVVFCINISAVELHHDQFVEKLQNLLSQYQVSASSIELEITETSLVDVNEKSIQTLLDIRKLGVSLALDDFGTGYTAFSQLINYPVNCLKIDKSFIDDFCPKNETKITMLNVILTIAKAYKLQTVAEGIETKEQLEFMQQNHCDMLQGYYLSKPVSLNHFLTLLN